MGEAPGHHYIRTPKHPDTVIVVYMVCIWANSGVINAQYQCTMVCSEWFAVANHVLMAWVNLDL